MKTEREKPKISGLDKNRKIMRMRRPSLRGKYFSNLKIFDSKIFFIFGLLAAPVSGTVKFTLGSTSSKVEQGMEWDKSTSHISYKMFDKVLMIDPLLMVFVFIPRPKLSDFFNIFACTLF